MIVVSSEHQKSSGNMTGIDELFSVSIVQSLEFVAETRILAGMKIKNLG